MPRIHHKLTCKHTHTYIHIQTFVCVRAKMHRRSISWTPLKEDRYQWYLVFRVSANRFNRIPEFSERSLKKSTHTLTVECHLHHARVLLTLKYTHKHISKMHASSIMKTDAATVLAAAAANVQREFVLCKTKSRWESLDTQLVGVCGVVL